MAEDNKRLNAEWLVINALRENLSLITESESVSYNDTIRFAQENFKDLFKHKESFFGKKRIVSHEYEKYEQEALAKSRVQKKQIKAEELIQDRINEIDRLLSSSENYNQKFGRLKAEQRKLRKLLKEVEPRFTLITENQALLNDFSYKRPGLTYRNSYAGKHNTYVTKTGKQFVLRFLHPGVPETATGVDLIYEIFDNTRDTVRIIAIQYKMWEGEALYFSQHKNLNRQLKNASGCFCRRGFCKAPDEEIHYRLPFCIPFLRPTDKIYDTNKLLTSGWHIPVCQVSKITDYTSRDEEMLTLDKIREVSLNTEEFERLFQQGKIGSRWLPIEEVEKIYRENNVLGNNEHIIIYAQTLRNQSNE